MKALICDDSDLTRSFLETALKTHLKFDVVSCSNGLEGIRLLNRSKFDLIISDFDMKIHKGNGIDLFYFALNNHPKTPFYLLSGSDVVLSLFEGHSQFKYFHKFEIVELMDELEKLRKEKS